MRLTNSRPGKARSTLLAAGFFAAASLLIAPPVAAGVTATDSCTGTVTGKVGERVYVHGAAVKGIVRDAAEERATGLNALLMDPDRLARDIEAAGELEVGQVPDASTGSVPGEAIGTAVRRALDGNPALGTSPQRTLEHIASRVTERCGLTVQASNYVGPTKPGWAPAPPDGPGSPPDGQQDPSQPGSADAAPDASGDVDGSPGAQSGAATASRRDYSDIPFEAPEFSPGADRSGYASDDDTHADEDSTTDANGSEALASHSTPRIAELPIVLAVISLAGVSAALVRTWLLRGGSAR